MENMPPAGLNLPPLPKPIPGYPQLNPVSVFTPFEHPPVEEDDSIWQKLVNAVTSPKLMDIMIGLILLVLLVPSTMAIASWNAVPGDLTYSWKIVLEKSLLLVLRPSKELSSSTQVAITQRRFSEATQMFSSNQAQVGLTNLTAQITTTSDSIKDINSKTARKDLANKYIRDLIEVNNKLEKEKLARKARRPIPSPPPPTTTQTKNTDPQPTPIPPPPTDDVDAEIDDTQQIIEDTIIDLENLQQQAQQSDPTQVEVTPTITPTMTSAQPTLTQPTLTQPIPTITLAPTAEPTTALNQFQLDTPNSISPSEQPKPTEAPADIAPTTTVTTAPESSQTP